MLLSLCALALLPGAAFSASSSSSSPALLAGAASSAAGWTFLPAIRGAVLDVGSFAVAANSSGSSSNAQPTLPAYMTQGVDARNVKRVVVMQHGDDRDAWDSWTVSPCAPRPSGQEAATRRSGWSSEL
jgi:hypothetical protein